jgi:hypothetical protein
MTARNRGCELNKQEGKLLKIRHSRESGNPAILFNMLLWFVLAAQEIISLTGFPLSRE